MGPGSEPASDRPFLAAPGGGRGLGPRAVQVPYLNHCYAHARAILGEGGPSIYESREPAFF
jgi:hypothetical protein